jgi:hypothetical protein
MAGAVIAAALGGAVAPAWAQPTPAPLGAAPEPRAVKPWSRGTTPEDRRVATELFLEGNRLFRAPLFARAAAHYTAALARWKHPAFYFNLALAQLHLGKDLEARDHLERALRYGPEPLADEGRFREGQKQLRELEAQLGRVRITCPTPGAVVSVDGVARLTGPGSHTAWVLPKALEITARKPDHLAELRQVSVAAGALVELELRLITLDEAADASRRWATWKPWAVVGAGAAIAAAGGALHFRASRNEDRYGSEFLRLSCASTTDQASPGCEGRQISDDLSDQLTRARRQQQAAIGAYLAGGTVVAAGLALMVLNRPRLVERSPASAGGTSVAIVPALSPEMAGVFVHLGL